MSNVLLSGRALSCDEDLLLSCELELATARTQAAVVRTFLDEIERTAPGTEVHDALAEQLIEELARLGTGILEVAAKIERQMDDALLRLPQTA
jgi:hypothetical protein